MAYDHITLEKKWQKFWEENQVFRTKNPEDTNTHTNTKERNNIDSDVSSVSVSVSSSAKPKKYILDMFPYPSGAGLHVGHPKGYTATDIVSRYYHAKGYNVLHTMGWDAFGLPAENYAIKTGTHPRVTTAANIETFRGQMQALGFSYDWDRDIDTTDPDYYRWTQWIFLELFKRGLAYEQDLPINYCPSCKTGLANEEVLSDNTCDRCGTKVERRPIRQWVLKITEYADRLIEDLEGLDWPEGIKEMQRNWIGKSEGCEFRMMKSVTPTGDVGQGGFGARPVALILHGWEKEGTPEVNRHWQTWLKGELEKIGYEVFMPDLPGYDRPDLETQIAFLDQYRERLDERSVIIGHSMGGFLAMHFVERLGKKIDKLICVAPVFYGIHEHIEGAQAWDFARTEIGKIGLASLRNAYSLEKVSENVLGWKVFLSENDAGISYSEAKKHFESILGVEITSIPDAGHFCDRDGYSTFPALLEAFDHIRVYTTRVDTVYGMTYAVLAPDHPKVDDFITPEQRAACLAYIEGVKGKSDLDRTNEGKEKTGVFTGSYVVNPFNGESVPLWVADFVLGSYGTGALMAVPAHDERDFEFAKKFGLPIKQSVRLHFTYTDEHRPKSDVETIVRPVVDVILENEKGEFLLLDEKNGFSIHFIGGGIEPGDDEESTVKKEILEETGYTDIEIIGAISGTYCGSYGYRATKGKNQESYGRFFHVRLLSENRVSSEVEEGKHSMKWYKKEEVADTITWKVHGDAWKIFLSGMKPVGEDGYLVNSGEYDGLSSAEARRVLSEKAQKEGFGHKKVNYKLRDWLFSRQRYWGEPIPLIHISHEEYAKLPILRFTHPDIRSLIENAGNNPVNEWLPYDSSINIQSGDSLIIDLGENRKFLARVHRISVYDTLEEFYEGRDFILTTNDQASDFEEFCEYYRGYTEYMRALEESLRVSEYNLEIVSQVYDGLYSKIIIDSNLPVTLPEVEKYEPAGDGQSPLATVPDWVNVKLAENLSGKRETNTMPQWGGSCWYYLRYMDPKNPGALAGREALEYWQNVDEYVGGAEHAVLHLLYARFWHKVLYDIGVVPTLEPFQKLTNVGMILAYAYEREDGGLVAVDLVEERDGKFFEKETEKEVRQVVAKMSKSLKNVVNPNDIVREYGADTLRLYEMSMSAFTDTAPWNPSAIVGVRRFLDKAYATFVAEDRRQKAEDSGDKDMKKMKLLHKTVKKVGEDIVEYKFNTAISSLMILLNEGIPSDPEFALEWKEKFAVLLHPFAPHMAEELFELVKSEKGGIQNTDTDTLESGILNLESIYHAPWPGYDDFMLVDDEVTIAVQVNGKLRGTLSCFNGVAQDEVSALAHADPAIMKWIEGKILVKEIYIPNKMLSIVVRDE